MAGRVAAPATTRTTSAPSAARRRRSARRRKAWFAFCAELRGCEYLSVAAPPPSGEGNGGGAADDLRPRPYELTQTLRNVCAALGTLLHHHVGDPTARADSGGAASEAAVAPLRFSFERVETPEAFAREWTAWRRAAGEADGAAAEAAAAGPSSSSS